MLVSVKPHTVPLHGFACSYILLDLPAYSRPLVAYCNVTGNTRSERAGERNKMAANYPGGRRRCIRDSDQEFTYYLFGKQDDWTWGRGSTIRYC